jgi:hypothetical protein
MFACIGVSSLAGGRLCSVPPVGLLIQMYVNKPYKSAFYSRFPEDEPVRFETWKK